MKRNGKGHQKLLTRLLEFFRYIVAGNVLFLSTYAFYFLLSFAFNLSSGLALAIGSIVGHVLFFVLDKSWVFANNGKRRKTGHELVKFAVFMGFNYFLNLAIVLGIDKWLGIDPLIGQFVAAGFFTLWNYVGLKYWVFYARGGAKNGSR